MFNNATLQLTKQIHQAYEYALYYYFYRAYPYQGYRLAYSQA